MSLAAFLIDTETTDTDNPEVIELAYMGPLYTPLTDAPVECLNFRPSKPISLGALATHHIIESDLKDYPVWPGRWLPDSAGVGYLVGHNCDFDWKAIGMPAGLKRICTLALARHVWPTIDSHRLEALIYHLYPHAMARELVKNAHNAAADVGLCYRVLAALWDAVGKPDTWERFWQISERARIPAIMPMGKHKGMPIAHVPNDYKRWLLKQPDVDPYLAQALRATM